MTMRYLNRDGTIFEGEMARDAVIALRTTSRMPAQDVGRDQRGLVVRARDRRAPRVAARGTRADLPSLKPL
jgi:hypothetical protein